MYSQNVPLTASSPWESKAESRFTDQLHRIPSLSYPVDVQHEYTIAELINLAESHNPQTKVAWERAKERGQALGVSEAALFPVISAVALASTQRDGALIGEGFHRQTIGLFQPTLNLDYLVFDFGRRGGEIEQAKAELFAADFAFNDVHRRLIYSVTERYYQLLNAKEQRDAAHATLLNAQTVERDAQARLDHGLATMPDLLEAQAATAQADYDLQAALGVEEEAQGDLATSLGLFPDTMFQVQGMGDLRIPASLPESVEEAIDRALGLRPDLLERVAELRSADAAIQEARSAFLPSLSFSGQSGIQRGYGQQDLLPGAYAQAEAWSAQLNLHWTLFDGGRQERALAEAHARRAEATASIRATQIDISDEVWSAYSRAKTALRQKQASTALLASADKSYTAALRAYDLGVRSLLDVVAAQRGLAQARSADVTASAQVLTEFANLAFQTGELLRNPTPRVVP